MSDPADGHRALAVFQDGAVIGERYADGFTDTTPLLSWSMAKSVTATMVGIAAYKGLLDIDDTPPIREWSGPDDPRAAITWRDLLQMQSSLGFVEDYGSPTSDVNRMLWRAASAADVAIASPLLADPGEIWSYSSGTTNLIQKALRTTLEAAGVDYHQFAHEELFRPLGAATAVLEPDNAGDFIGSSFMYASARDWAKLGQLYLQDGVWDGERLLPVGWTDFVSTPAAQSDGQYGGQFWLNYPGADGRGKYVPELPESGYMMAGHDGQYVLILPESNIVMVRLGITRGTPAIEVSGPIFAEFLNILEEAESDNGA